MATRILVRGTHQKEMMGHPGDRERDSRSAPPTWSASTQGKIAEHWVNSGSLGMLHAARESMPRTWRVTVGGA